MKKPVTWQMTDGRPGGAGCSNCEGATGCHRFLFGSGVTPSARKPSLTSLWTMTTPLVCSRRRLEMPDAEYCRMTTTGARNLSPLGEKTSGKLISCTNDVTKGACTSMPTEIARDFIRSSAPSGTDT